MKSNFYFKLASITPQKSYKGGSITSVTSKEVPGFVHISFELLRLLQSNFQEPIWHPNANKIGYCLEGKALVSIRTPDIAETFTVVAGDLFFIPLGYIHEIVNIGENELTISFAFDHTDPELMCLSKAIYSLSDNVFDATFKASPGFLEGLKKSKNQELIKSLPAKKEVPQSIPSQYKFNINESHKPIITKGGYLQNGTKASLPVLNGLGVLRFGLNPEGNVEPHWHTNAGELVYIVKGKTRITILSPSGSQEVLEVSGGEGAFAPASYFHNIENIGPDEVEVIAFFSHAEPDYIGIGEVVGSYPSEMLASLFNVSPNYFDTFKKPSTPLVIVPI